MKIILILYTLKVLVTDSYTWQIFTRVYLQDPKIVNESFVMCNGW